MKTGNRFYWFAQRHNDKLDNMAEETDRQADAVQDEAERVQRVKPKTILRKRSGVNKLIAGWVKDGKCEQSTITI